MRRRRIDGEDVLIFGFFGVVGLFIAAIVLALPIYTYASYHHVQQWTCKVEDKDRTRTDSGSDMRVYTDCGNFVVQDAMFKKNFHSSDTFRELERGKTYELTTIGFRIPFLSEFPNIVEVKPA